MTMNKAYNPTWFTYNELSQITPMPAGVGPDGLRPEPLHHHGVRLLRRLHLPGQPVQEPVELDQVADLVDRRRPVAAERVQLRRQLHVRPEQELRRPGQGEAGASSRRCRSRPSRPSTTCSRPGRGRRQPEDRRRLPAHHRRAAPSRPTPSSDRTRSTATTLSPLYLVGDQLLPAQLPVHDRQRPIIKQLYFRQALQYLMNQAAVISGPLKGYGLPTVGPVGSLPGDQLPVRHRQAGRPVARITRPRRSDC